MSYAKEALENLQVWSKLQKQMVFTNNARAALMLVERGETSYGIVYKTDALLSSKLTIVDVLPKESHQPILYSMALTTVPPNPDTQQLFEYLQSSEAIDILLQNNFTAIHNKETNDAQ